jgi:hypothetical protein
MPLSRVAIRPPGHLYLKDDVVCPLSQPSRRDCDRSRFPRLPHQAIRDLSGKRGRRLPGERKTVILACRPPFPDMLSNLERQWEPSSSSGDELRSRNTVGEDPEVPSNPGAEPTLVTAGLACMAPIGKAPGHVREV